MLAQAIRDGKISEEQALLASKSGVAAVDALLVGINADSGDAIVAAMQSRFDSQDIGASRNATTAARSEVASLLETHAEPLDSGLALSLKADAEATSKKAERK